MSVTVSAEDVTIGDTDAPTDEVKAKGAPFEGVTKDGAALDDADVLFGTAPWVTDAKADNAMA